MVQTSSAADGSARLRRNRFLIIRNRTAGQATNRIATHVAHALRARHGTVEIAETGTPAELAGLAEAAAGADAVLVAGGDGSFRACARAFAGLGVPLGLIPAGTGNVLAQEIALPGTAEQLAETFTHGPVERLSGGLANGAPFFLMAGAGFDADVVRRLSHGVKRYAGKAAYALPVLGALARVPPEFEVRIDGHPYAARWLIVTRARHYGGRFVISPASSLFRPGLTALVFTGSTMRERLAELLGLARGRLQDVPTVRSLPARSVSISAPHSVPVQVDGDFLATGALDVSEGALPLDLIVPAGSAARI